MSYEQTLVFWVPKEIDRKMTTTRFAKRSSCVNGFRDSDCVYLEIEFPVGLLEGEIRMKKFMYALLFALVLFTVFLIITGRVE